jgi:hypothetical protein
MAMMSGVELKLIVRRCGNRFSITETIEIKKLNSFT